MTDPKDTSEKKERPQHEALREFQPLPAEPNMPDEAGEASGWIDRAPYAREEPEPGRDDASGLPGEDERRGERRKKLYEEGATEVDEID